VLLSLLLSGLRLAPVPVVDAFVAVLRDQGPDRPAGHGKVDSKCRAGPAGHLIVCAEAATVRQVVAEADRALPNVIVMDVRLQDSSGIEATRDIRAARPQTQVLMLTSADGDQALSASIMAGAAGVVLKPIRGDDLIQAIWTVGAGQSLLDPAVTKGVLDRLRKGKHLLKYERLARLTGQKERDETYRESSQED
jgi:DNA-binding NarL/FixJ family response regulator